MSDVHIDKEQRRMLPHPGWNPLHEPFWFAAGQGELVVKQCNACGSQHWPPSAACYDCNSQDLGWGAVPGTGTVFSYTWADWPVLEGADRNITVIELDGVKGPDPVRMISWVVEIERDQLQVGLPVEVTFLEVDDEVSVPAWRPRS